MDMVSSSQTVQSTILQFQRPIERLQAFALGANAFQLHGQRIVTVLQSAHLMHTILVAQLQRIDVVAYITEFRAKRDIFLAHLAQIRRSASQLISECSDVLAMFLQRSVFGLFGRLEWLDW